jgi:hypothetical protein
MKIRHGASSAHSTPARSEDGSNDIRRDAATACAHSARRDRRDARRLQAMCAQLIAHEYMQAAHAHHDDDDERRAKSIFCSAQVSAWVH